MRATCHPLCVLWVSISWLIVGVDGANELWWWLVLADGWHLVVESGSSIGHMWVRWLRLLILAVAICVRMYSALLLFGAERDSCRQSSRAQSFGDLLAAEEP